MSFRCHLLGLNLEFKLSSCLKINFKKEKKDSDRNSYLFFFLVRNCASIFGPSHLTITLYVY